VRFSLAAGASFVYIPHSTRDSCDACCIVIDRREITDGDWNVEPTRTFLSCCGAATQHHPGPASSFRLLVGVENCMQESRVRMGSSGTEFLVQTDKRTDASGNRKTSQTIQRRERKTVADENRGEGRAPTTIPWLRVLRQRREVRAQDQIMRAKAAAWVEYTTRDTSRHHGWVGPNGRSVSPASQEISPWKLGGSFKRECKRCLSGFARLHVRSTRVSCPGPGAMHRLIV
jgi:hypothetical protein